MSKTATKIHVQVDVLQSLVSEYRKYGQDVQQTYRTSKYRVERELDVLLRTYSSYGTVIGKVHELKDRLRLTENSIRELHDLSQDLSRRLLSAVDVYTEQERMEKELIRQLQAGRMRFGVTTPGLTTSSRGFGMPGGAWHAALSDLVSGSSRYHGVIGGINKKVNDVLSSLNTRISQVVRRLKIGIDDELLQDPVVQQLHDQALNGTDKEREEAWAKLEAIFAARNTIARAQAAYEAYQALGNTAYMNLAHKEANRNREILRSYGIDEKYFKIGVIVRHYYPGTSLEACSYDPSMILMKNGKPVLVEKPADPHYLSLLDMVITAKGNTAWAKQRLGEIHEHLREIGRAQVAWFEYDERSMEREKINAHVYAEKLRGILKTEYQLSSSMVDGVDYRHLWTGTGYAGKAIVADQPAIEAITPVEFGRKLNEFNGRIKDLSNTKQKISALVERNQWLLPHLAKAISDRSVESSLTKFLDHYKRHKHRYEKVAKETGVPPELIAAIHWRESTGSFNTYLHNGEPLGEPTKKSPKGKLFDNWEDAAIDAIRSKSNLIELLELDFSTRDVAKMMAFAEGYNGLGYVNRAANSVYVFNGTNVPLQGKFYADGKFTLGPVNDKNPGIALMLASLIDVQFQSAPSVRAVENGQQGQTVSGKGTVLLDVPALKQETSLGCAISSFVMVANYHGISTDFKTVEKKFVDKNYLINFANAAKAYGLKYSELRNSTEKDILPLAKERLDRGEPVLVQMYKKTSAKTITHFVVVVGYTGNGTSADQFIVNDPATGKQTTLDKAYRYNEAPVSSIRFFEK